LRAETAAALGAVRAARPVLIERRGAGERRSKARLDEVTAGDVAVERLLIERLTAAFPAYGVLGEETGRQGGRDAFWVLDPICGTSNYAAGLPLYNVNVALVERGQATVAVVGEPVAGRLSWAERGGGAWASDAGGAWRPTAASDASGLVSIDFGHRTSTGKVDVVLGVMAAILRKRLWNVRVLQTSLVMAWLAGGRLAGHVVDAVHPWDMCAGALLCHEAGALVTDFQGRPWRWDSSQLVCAASPATHAALLELLGSCADGEPRTAGRGRRASWARPAPRT
jgi:myo-inositol-1(or 4)-monophosphatase